ncbi:MAG: NUDIX domain-containing protein [Parasphingopyxis sp.]|uniref:NUDIX hydrolase n=1 Tax=Parasphingopyxis sp. TaxID=1920299 RepID=UPI0032EE2AC6
MLEEVEDKAGIPAATLVLMRDSADGPPEVLMVERAAKMAFAGGAMVFPGGRIDEGDHALAANEALVRGAPDDKLEAAGRVAAIRETLEETGVAVGFDPMPDEIGAAQMREGLHEEGDFGAMLATAGHRLDLSVMTPWARWKPNFRQERTFDTWFFIARAPERDAHEADGGESVSSRWAAAQQVIDEAEAGKCSIIFPTHRNLERLAQWSDFATARAHAESIPVRMITPWTEERDGERWICIPDDAGYPVTGQPLGNERRA